MYYLQLIKILIVDIVWSESTDLNIYKSLPSGCRLGYHFSIRVESMSLSRTVGESRQPWAIFKFAFFLGK